MLSVAGGKFLHQVRNKLFEKIIKTPFEETVNIGREQIKKHFIFRCDANVFFASSF